MLKDLLEKRDAAAARFEAFITPLIDEQRELTDEETAQKTALRAEIDRLDQRIDEVTQEEQRSAALAEARQRAGVNKVDVQVVNEPSVYGEGSPNSWIADVVRSKANWPGSEQASERLARYAYENAVEMAKGTKAGKRAERQITEVRRASTESEIRDNIASLRKLGAEEYRTGVTTGSSSGGSFVTPIYLVDDYAPWREPGRAFLNAANSQPLPPYGMTINLPAMTGPAGVATQSTQNTAVQETDPTAGYITANLVTLAGEVTVAQQLLDRAGPNFAFDRVIWDQLQRDYNAKADVYALTQALANAGSITYTAGSFALTTTSGVGGFLSKVAGGKSAIQTTSGLYANPSHLFTTPSRFDYISAFADANGRPVVVPNYAGVMNAVAGGSPDGDTGVEGNSGFRILGLPVFTDNNIPTPGTGADQAIVADMAEVYVFEGDLVTRVLPQTLGNQLSVILQVYAYMAVLVRYNAAVQSISGTGMASISF